MRRLVSPYALHDPASRIAIHGGEPFATVSTTTATDASANASRCAPVGVSSRSTPIAIVASGAMKYPSAVSMTRPSTTAQT